MMAYTLGMSAYGVYLSYCDYKGITPVTEVSFNANTKGARPSTREKHENGQARKDKDKGREKGDLRRKSRSNKRR